MMTIVRSDEEVDALLNAVTENIDHSKYPGQNYESGVHDAILWLTGQSDEHPYPENE